jgi:hypothetical protein
MLSGLLNNSKIAPWFLCNRSLPFRRKQLVSYLLLAFSVADSRLQLNVIAVTQIRTPQTYISSLPETFKIYTKTTSVLSFRLCDLQKSVRNVLKPLGLLSRGVLLLCVLSEYDMGPHRAAGFKQFPMPLPIPREC